MVGATTGAGFDGAAGVGFDGAAGLDGAGFDGVVVFETVGFVGGWIGTFPAGTVGAAGLAGALAGAVLF